MPYAPSLGEFSERAHETVPVPMPDGWRRPLGIAPLKDKILLQAMAEVLNAIYETDFRVFLRVSACAQPASSVRCNHGLRSNGEVNWVLDAAIRRGADGERLAGPRCRR
jgi:hypothetical protein